MDNRIQKLVDLTESKLQLNKYYLKRYSLDRRVNIDKETKYHLNMEWFPNDRVISRDEDSNPEGAAVISIDIASEKFTQIVFVKGKSLVDDYLFGQSSKSEIINWIERETGYVYESDFILKKESTGKYIFSACVDGVKSFPEGSIQLEHDYLGRLTLFSVEGEFPRRDCVVKSEDNLPLEEVEHLAKDQLKLINIPSDLTKMQIPVYIIDEVFIKKSGLLTTPFKVFNSVKKHYVINQLIYWEKPLEAKFKREDLKLSEELSIEQVFSKEKSPDARPISSLQRTECINAVKDFLRQVYPSDSGKWILDTLNRDHGYIHAVLKEKEATQNVLERKITVMIDREKLQVINYIDNEPLLKLMNEYKESHDIIVSEKLGFEVIHEYITFEPYYVFDFEINKYIFAKKLSCDYAVNANNGKVTLLNEIE